jgi:hypothetical protein
MTIRKVTGTVVLVVGFVCFFASGIAAFFGKEPTWDPLPSGGLSWGLWGASFALILLGGWLRGDDWWDDL